jgi:hypothetical protein
MHGDSRASSRLADLGIAPAAQVRQAAATLLGAACRPDGAPERAGSEES